MKVYLGADHRGFELKEQIKQWLNEHSIEYYDLGADELIPDDDFNDYAIMVSKEVLKNPDSYGVLLCGSAQGMCMQANRFKGIRAVFCRDVHEATVTREHNDANILCVSADEEHTNYREVLETFLRTGFLGLDRYVRRNKKLDEEQTWPN